MSTLYWITVLGNLQRAASTFFVLSLIVLVLSLVLWADTKDGGAGDVCFKKIMKYSLCVFISCLLCAIFIPSKAELYLIYGVGSTMDYIKENPTAKQLPDKFIKAIDKWADNLTEEQKEKKGDY